MAVYWTFMEFPDWFRNGSAGWFPLAFVHHDTLQQIQAGLSGLMAIVLRLFFASAVTAEHGLRPDSYSFNATGIRLCRGQAPPWDLAGLSLETLHLYASFACFLADEKAHKEINGSKGASGTKPCHQCQNVMGRLPPDEVPEGGPIVHFSCGDVERLVPHTQ